LRKYLIIGIVFIAIASFSPFRKKWVKTKKENIVLYTRPENFTGYTSPNSDKINAYLDEGIESVKEINEILGVNFDSKIMVYLYNYDEAKEQIGTNGGGGAIVNKRIIYYTYYKDSNNIDKKRNRIIYIGAHEYVHIVSFNTIGFSRTRLFTEGYANAIDGYYAGQEIEEYLDRKIIKTPTELLEGEEMLEGVFYPQSGFFIKWLFQEYSIEKSNKLFVLTKDGIISEFEGITGDTFYLMEKKYSDYCDKYFQ
jgi:hypothetical protein